MQCLLRNILPPHYIEFCKTGSTWFSLGKRIPIGLITQNDIRLLKSRAQDNLKIPVDLRSATKLITKPDIGSDFQIVFKFPYVVHVRTLCRFKIYQTAFTLLMVPGMVAAYTYDVSTIENCQNAIVFATLACGVMYVVSGLFRRLIGIIYINQNCDTVKLAHLTFWGNRRDVTLAITDIVPFNEDLENKPTNLYHKLKSYSSKEYYFYVTRFGGVTNPELFQLILGDEVPYPKQKNG